MNAQISKETMLHNEGKIKAEINTFRACGLCSKHSNILFMMRINTNYTHTHCCGQNFLYVLRARHLSLNQLFLLFRLSFLAFIYAWRSLNSLCYHTRLYRCHKDPVNMQNLIMRMKFS